MVEKPLDEDDVIAITIEPDGGSQQPTTDPMLTAKALTPRCRRSEPPLRV